MYYIIILIIKITVKIKLGKKKLENKSSPWESKFQLMTLMNTIIRQKIKQVNTKKSTVIVKGTIM